MQCLSRFDANILYKTKVTLEKLKVSCINAGLSSTNIHSSLNPNKINPKNLDKSYYYLSLMEQFKSTHLSFSENYQQFFSILIIQYLFNYFKNNQDHFLYSLLIQTFLYSSKVYETWEQTNEIISGIYVIINAKTYEAYIGKSWNIMARFENHQETLLENSHHNRRLQEAFNTEREQPKLYEESSFFLNNFFFLLLQVQIFSDKERMEKEVAYIQSWAGALYNILHNRPSEHV